MKTLTTLDLNRLPVDETAFLARVLELGHRLNRFPEPFYDALNAYLQKTAMDHARRFRTGIKIRQEDLMRGVRRAAVCLDAGLESEASGDLNIAMDLFRPDRFEQIRNTGWEIVYARLSDIRRSAIRILNTPYRGLLKGDGKRLRRWTTIRADDGSAEDSDGKRSEMDLMAEFGQFERVRRESRFLGSLPRGLVRGLPEAERRSWGFSDVVRAVVLALAADGEDLILDEQAKLCLAGQCDERGFLKPAAREKVERLLADHLGSNNLDVEYRDWVMKVAGEALEDRALGGPGLDTKAVDASGEK